MKQLSTLLFILAFFTNVRAQAPAWWHSFGPVEKGNFGGGHADHEKEADAAAKATIAKEDFEEWETFEDELVRLSYPKAPGVKIRVNGGKSGIKVEGGVCTTVDNSFTRAYEVMCGPFTMGVFLVAKADWLDDGICLCGPMIHHVYQMREGCLVRYSLLPGGAVKKAQMLGGKLRLMAFEWTHLACQRQVYEQMVDRMVLKVAHPWKAARLQQEVAERYGMTGRSGWLYPGATVAQADVIMGSLSQVADGKVTWMGVQDDYPCALSAVFKDGRLVRLADSGVDKTGEPARKGSLNWASDLLENEDSENAKKPALTAARIQEVLEAVVKLSDTVQKDDWWRLRSIIGTLTESHQVRDKRLTEVVVKHAEGSHGELQILQRLEYADVKAWLSTRLEKMRAERPSTEKHAAAFFDPVSARADDGANLLLALKLVSPKEAAAAARGFLETGERAWIQALLKTADEDGACMVPSQELAVKGMELGIDERSEELLTETMDFIASAPGLTDKVTLQNLISSLPVGEPDDQWEKSKEAARAALREKKKAPDGK